MRLVPAFGLGSPAAVEMGRCDRIYYDPLQWLFLDQGERRFILEHERAHCVGGVVDEAQADKIALEAIAQAGIDPINAYEAIIKTLDSQRPEHRQRAAAIQQQIAIMSAPRQTASGNNYSPAAGTSYPIGQNPEGSGSQPAARGNAIDWTDVLTHGIDVAGEVTGDLLGGYLGNSTEAPPPSYSTVPSKLPTWAYLAMGVGLLALGYFLFKS